MPFEPNWTEQQTEVLEEATTDLPPAALQTHTPVTAAPNLDDSTIDTPFPSVPEGGSAGTIDLPAAHTAPEDDPTGDATIDVPAAQAEPDGTVDLSTAQAEADGTVDLPADQAEADGTVDLPIGQAEAEPNSGATIDAPSEQRSVPGSGSQQSRSSGAAQKTQQRRFDATGAASLGTYLPVAPEMRSGRYLLKQFHAKGGMGEIWLAEDVDLGRSVAVKKIRGTPNDDQKDQFLREAQVTGQLEHPGVVPVHELGVDEAGQPFYSMKFIQGRTLTEVIADYHATPPKGNLPREVQGLHLLQIFLNVCQTVAYAHSRGVIHRDLKPDNVMVGAYGETLLLDWGLAKPLGVPDEPSTPGSQVQIRNSYSGETAQTQDGAVKGTGSYMSPEVAEGRVADIDQVSDIFLLGGTLYHILTGKKPRQAKKVADLIWLAINQKPTPPRKLDPTVPRTLDAICMKALALSKEDRYASATAMAEDVQRHLAGEPVLAYQENFWERSLRWAKRHRVALTRTVAALVLIGLVIFGVNEYFQAQARHEQELLAAQKQREDEVNEANEKRQLEQRKAEDLARKEQAGKDLKAFRRLVDETQQYAAFQDRGAEYMPYYDPKKGEATARAALALVSPWGPRLEELPLAEERPRLRAELYDLLLLVAQMKARSARGSGGTAVAKEMLALLDRATPLREPTVVYHRLRGEAYGVLGDKDRAAAEQRRAQDPKTPTLAIDYFLTGEQYSTEKVHQAQGQDQDNQEQLNLAIQQYRKALALDLSNFWAHIHLGKCYLAIGRVDLAAETVEACVALRPESPWGYMLRGLFLGMGKRYPEALADLNKGIALKGDLRLLRLYRGYVNWLHKKYDDALVDFDAVLEQPNEQRLLFAAIYRGQIHLRRGEEDQALADFTLAVSDKRMASLAYLNRAQFYFDRGDTKKGMADLEVHLVQSSTFAPQSPEGHDQRGWKLRQLARDMSPAVRKTLRLLALEELEKAVAKGGRQPNMFDHLGAVLQDLGRLSPAIKAYSEAIRWSPPEARLLVKRGWAYEGVNQYDDALADFANALKIDPTYAEAHAGLGYIQACQGKVPAEASRRALEAVLFGSGDYLALHNVACVYGKLSEKDAKRAREYQDLALACLRREIDLWRKDHKGPNPIPLIRREPAFPAGLRARPEFLELIAARE